MTSQAFCLATLAQWQPAVRRARRPAPRSRLAAGALVARSSPTLCLVLAPGARRTDPGRAVLKRARAAGSGAGRTGCARLHGPRRAARAAAVADEDAHCRMCSSKILTIYRI